jgi:peptidoglycan/LPS O-acetylase OafA/YrhL
MTAIASGPERAEERAATSSELREGEPLEVSQLNSAIVSPEGDGRFTALDGLRGIAIVAVVVFHYGYDLQLTDPIRGPASLVFTFFDFGWLGVDLFFALSGFLITRILLSSKHQPHYFKSFYVRRALRIFPPYYGLLIAALVLAPLSGHTLFPEWVTRHQAWLWLYGMNFVRHAHWADLEHLWTLAIEEHFYVVWPFLVVSLTTPRLRQACYLSVPIALAVRFCGLHTALELYEFRLARFDSLAIGGLLATFSLESTVVRNRAKIVAGVGGALSIAILALSRVMPNSRPSVLCFGYPLFAVTFSAIVFLAAARALHPTVLRVLNWPVLRNIGKYSYGIYLFHIPILRASGWVAPFLGIRTSTFGGKLSWIIVHSVLAYLVAYASWNLYERRFLRLKMYFLPS